MKNSILTAILGAILLSACGEAPTAAPTSTIKSQPASGNIRQGAFKVYQTSRAVPDTACDIYTRLVLANGITGPVASLESAVSGPCEMTVNGTTRTFNLTEIASECGTRHYQGDGIAIIDNRGRFCEDIVEADLIVKEASTSVEEMIVTTTFYSFDPLH